MRSRFRKAPVPLAVGALIAGSLSVIAAAPAAAVPTTVYDSVPAELAPSYISQPFQAEQVNEFGDYVLLGEGDRVVDEVTVGFVDWACESDWTSDGEGGWDPGPGGPCTTTEGATWSHPITVNLYDANNSGALPVVGDLIASVTETVEVPYRPSADPTCANPAHWRNSATNTCHSGYAFTATFDFSGEQAVVADDVIVTVAFNTQTRGPAPIGAGGPYNSLNVALEGGAPAIGEDENPGEFLVNSNSGNFYPDGAAGGTNVLRTSTKEWSGGAWTDYAGLILAITADDALLSGPVAEVIVRQKDVKPTETPETYLDWHEGNTPGGYQVREDGLNLGSPSASTIIKGVDPEANVISEADLRRYIAKAGVEVASGSVTFQIPVFFQNVGDAVPTFTTLRSTSLTAGSHTFDLDDIWATTKPWGGYSAHEEAPLGQLISDLYDLYDGVALAGFGVQADSLAVVPTLVWDDTTYEFIQPEIGECEAVADGPVATNLDSNGWTFLETRTQGHHEFTEDGIRVYTEAATSQDKAAAYRAVDLALSEVGEPGIEIVDYTGGRPSLQLGFDREGDGVWDSYLVYEPWAYGDGKFWSTQYVGVPAGQGYPSFGTLDDFLVANPDARLISIGWSLGSGVFGDATIASLTVGCVVYGFEYESPAEPTATERVWEGDIRPDESTYPGWHEGYENAEQSYQVDDEGLHLGDPSHSQIINGFDEPMTGADLEALITGAGVVVTEGSVTFQVPIFYGNGGEGDTPSFTTLRSLSLTAGDHEFSSVDRWVTSRAIVDNDGNVVWAANSAVHVADLVDFLEAQGGLQVLAFGVQSDYAATVTSITFDGTAYTFDGDIEGPYPTISGTAAVGETLTAVPGTWVPDDVTLAYQWRANGTPIEGATSSTLELTADLLDANVTVAVTGSLEGYDDVTRISNAQVVQPGTMTAGTVDVTGAVQVGSELTATPSGFSPEPTSYEYQWFADDVAIPGADDATFTVTIAQLGAEISVDVTGVRAGYTSATASAVAGEAGGSPVVVEAPSISGTPQIDQVLTADPGEWTPDSVTFTYQWRANGAEIPGATGATFTPGASQVGALISVTVTATPESGTPASATSDQVGPVAQGVLTAPTPTITGSATTGSTLTAVPGTWGPAPVTLSYQWYAGPTAIPGATSNTLTLSGAYVGDAIRVVVTGTKPGYATESKQSAPTSAVVSSDIEVERLSGSTRYDTAVEISQQFEAGVERVYLASGAGYADALSAGPVAAHDGAPLLLTTPGTLPTVVAEEIERLGPDEVIIVGGTGAVSAAVATQVGNLDGSPDVIRVGGANRYETSRNLIVFGFGADGADTAYIATGTGFPDALAAGPAAAHFDGPVVLVPGAASSVDTPTLGLLTQLGVEEVRIAGGTGAVSAAIEAQLKAIYGASDVLRTSGANRYLTAIAINAAEFDVAPVAYLATGTGFADALAGVALAGRDGAPLFTVPGTCIPEAVIDALDALGTSTLVLLGGTGALSQDVASLESCS